LTVDVKKDIQRPKMKN